MRVKRNVLLSLLISLVVSFSNVVPLWAAENEENVNNEWIASDGTYQFPITVEDEEWDKLPSVIEMREVTQIPDNILEEISTDDLIQLVLDYPLLCDIKAFGSISEGYEHVKNQFNAIPELLSRPDCYEKLLIAYENFVIPTEKIMDYDTLLSDDNFVEEFNALLQDEAYHELILLDGEIYNKLNVLEMLLKDVISSNTRNAVNTDAFVECYNYKILEKEASAYFKDCSVTSLLEILVEEENPLAYEFSAEALQKAAVSMASVPTITTPNGTAVTNFTYNTNLSYNDASQYADEFLSYNATLVSIASTTFNCHSYAWLRDRYSSTYQYIWLNETSVFEADPYYIKTNSPVAGDIVTWTGHSGVVSLVNQYNPETERPDTYMVSKWREGPIARHYMTTCPFWRDSSSARYYHHN